MSTTVIADVPDRSISRMLAILRASPDLGRLAAVRVAGQFGDGMFQAALSGAILFNPERQTDPFVHSRERLASEPSAP